MGIPKKGVDPEYIIGHRQRLKNLVYVFFKEFFWLTIIAEVFILKTCDISN